MGLISISINYSWPTVTILTLFFLNYYNLTISLIFTVNLPFFLLKFNGQSFQFLYIRKRSKLLTKFKLRRCFDKQLWD